jgi:hypothetical protein
MKINLNQMSKFIALFYVLLFSGCAILTVPIHTTPPNTPPNTDPKPSNPTNSGSTFSDPDNFKVVFKKEASDVYQNEFLGKARAIAKTTPSDRTTKNYNSVGDVLKNMPTDSYMRRMGVGDSSPRTEDEDFNVFIKKAYLFSIAKEEDGDFHLIIGDLENGEKKNLMTAEVAGLPKDKKSKAYFLLERTRRQLYEQFPEFFTSNKKTFTPRSVFPEIAIRGSLFFDIHHSAGQIGTGSVKPETVWEIHPITYLNFK